MGSAKTAKRSHISVIVITIVLCVLLNVLPAFLAWFFDLPLYLDTAGTIVCAGIAGVLPGITVAVATNVLCGFFNGSSMYYVFINVMIAMCAAWIGKYGKKKRKAALAFMLVLPVLFGGIVGTLFQWALLGRLQFADAAQMSSYLTEAAGMGKISAAMIVNLGINLLDKGLTVLAAIFIIRLIPAAKKELLSVYGWKQKPLSDEELKLLTKKSDDGSYSLKKRMSIMLVTAVVSLTLVMGWISITLYLENVRRDYAASAQGAADFAAEMVDASRIDEYLRLGKGVPGYLKTEEVLRGIRKNSQGVKYLYVIKLKEDGCYYVFDLEADDTTAYQPGDRADFEKAFEPYLPKLFAGEEIEPIESDDISGWVLTAYSPIKDANGVTVAYAGADVSMQYLTGYVRDFLLRVLFIFSGFFVLILGYGLWVSGYYLIYPINSMVALTNSFMQGGDDQEVLEENVKKMNALEIRTNDEVEKLYHAICTMAGDTAEKMKEIRHYAEATSQMQNGLIITMADMVENRDSDTGAHVQKTSAYVRIILEGLRDHGYYTEKLTDKYISDVEMSAPLHDVGKINIPDAVLNKPGKLTDEEYAIMKTHTTAGKKIIERAINTINGENYLKEARNMAAYHHERWDGKGYPEGLKGEVIPLSARVMAVADVFDALASPRVYKPAFSLEKSLEIITEGAGGQFDPRCVEVFLDSLDEVKKILRKFHGA
ncbi:MAG: HD domain-containing protein [Lachnospiraceae bacterium]|nr:HD domain-containing protein [Lachnospiraceae bacterium]